MADFHTWFVYFPDFHLDTIQLVILIEQTSRLWYLSLTWQKMLRNLIAQNFLDASFFFFTCDFATDFSSREQESIRIRLSYLGTVFDHLAGFEAPGANVNAEGHLGSYSNRCYVRLWDNS